MPGPDACFAPVVDSNTRLLILGSLPGVQSLVQGRYYGHPRNQFWRLTAMLIDTDLPSLDYDARLSALRGAGIGLWDVIAQAVRPGSLDSRIRDAVANPLGPFVATLPHLRVIAFNGGTAARIGLAQLPATPAIATITLPSSSPAHAIPFETKAASWAQLRQFLD